MSGSRKAIPSIYAMMGLGAFKDRPQPKLRALFSVYPELFTLVARQDANIRNFQDIRGKRVNIGDPGSGTRSTMDLVMKQFGIARSELKLATQLKFGEMASALCDNRIDAFVFVAGHPNAIFQEAATLLRLDHRAGRRPADRPADRRVSVLRRRGGARRDVSRARTRPSAALRVLATVVVSEDLPEAVAYLITKAVFDNFDDFKRLHPAIAAITRQGALQGNTVPFHPGAMRYFREKSLVSGS